MIDGKALRMITVHLDHQEDARRLKQAETLAKALENHHEPMILAGDFNDGPDSAPLKAFVAPWTAVPKSEPTLTCPASAPKTEIDHIFLRGLTATAPVKVLPEAVASDHRPLVARIALP